MSIGIGVILRDRDGVVLASDTRQRNAFEPADYKHVPGKVGRLADTIWAVTLGAVPATEAALKALRGTITPDEEPQAISEAVRDATRTTWEEFAQRLGLGEDSQLAAVLIVGGIAQGKGFLCGAYQTCYVDRGHREGIPRFLVHEPFNYVLFGGKRDGAHYETCHQGIQALKEAEDPVLGLLELIRETFDEAAANDPDVGGGIECVVIRPGARPQVSTLGVIGNGSNSGC